MPPTASSPDGPHGTLTGLERGLRAILGLTSAVLIAAIAVICFVEVVLRYVFAASLSWYDEFVGYLLVWLTFVGAVLAQSYGQHIGIDNLVERTSGNARRFLEVSKHALMVAIHLVLLLYGAQLVVRFLQEEAITLPVPMGVIYLVVPLSASLMLAVEGIQIVKLLSRPAEASPDRG